MTEPRHDHPYLRLVSTTGDHGAPGGEERNGDGPNGPDRCPSVKLLIGHSQRLVRAGYRALLERQERIEVVAEADSSRRAVELSAACRPHVALLDLELTGFDDAKAIARTVTRARLAEVAVILIAPKGSDPRVNGGLLAGAVGVVQRDVRPHELIGAVRVVAQGGALLPATLMRRLLAGIPGQPAAASAAPEKLKELTDREREIVALVSKGLTNGEIASLLVLSPKTVKTHVSRSMVKVGASHRSQLVVLAYQTGLMVPPPFDGKR